MPEHYVETKYGFEWGAAKIERGFSDKKKGWITMILTTPKHPYGIQIYVTKTGKVRVSSANGEWTPPRTFKQEAKAAQALHDEATNRIMGRTTKKGKK